MYRMSRKPQNPSEQMEHNSSNGNDGSNDGGGDGTCQMIPPTVRRRFNQRR